MATVIQAAVGLGADFEEKNKEFDKRREALGAYVDKTYIGKKIDVAFNGTLRDEQAFNLNV